MKPSLSMGDLNDFLEPAQICIKMPSEDGSKNRISEIKQVEVEINPSQSTSANHQPVTINLTDCLACSGCVTSAETVLISQQSWHFVKEAMEKNKKLVFSVSPQSRVAIADSLRLEVSDSDRRIVSYFQSIPNLEGIMDTNHARNYSLAAIAREFVEKYCGDKELPLLTSACPGWICFVEKTHPELIPLVSKARSPQQIMGVLVKEKHPEAFHVSVMPCYDKKLEASRSDFKSGDSFDVDCVLSTTELLDLLSSNETTVVADIGLSPFGSSHQGSGAGGYLEYTLKYASSILFPNEINPILKETLYRGNVDFVEYELLSSQSGQVLLKFARIWGMRNIQTWLRIHKTQPKKYHFVEVMACPGGCLNGGGQPPIMKTEQTKLAKLRELYNALPKMETPIVDEQLYKDLDERGLLGTNYRAVSLPKSSFAIKW